MYDEISKQWKTQGEAVVRSLQEIGEIHGRLLEGFKDQQLDLLELWRDTATKGTKVVTDAKDYKAVCEALPPLAKDYQRELVALSGGMRDLMNDWSAELFGWYSKQISALQKAQAPVAA